MMQEFLLDFQSLGIILALIMLILGSIIDIWKREIHDYYWIGFGGAGIVLGAKVPVVLPSRADDAVSRLAACALAVMLNSRK